MTEQEIEQALIEKLGDLKYRYRPDIRDRAALEHNFRQHFESLNRVHLTDSEFHRLLDSIITPDVFAAARHLRERNSFERDDGTPLYYTLVNIKDWCKNSFEVINQLQISTDYSHHRYDVILLINGIPVVQIELKTLAISPRRAMQQIVDYKNDPGNGYSKTLLCFLQLFIVSNRSDTWFFANNNRRHFSFNADERFLPLYQFADVDNTKITHLDSFADAFLAKCTLGEMISRYMVLVASEQKLMMMRPYQIYAVKAIVDCIHQHCGNGYIWHTTGSGKTLTSFKASTLLKDNPDIDKCLFVVDRKDLDRQTREEFNKFQEGCVEENTNTETLVRRLLSDDYADKVIVTTIQKLGLALDGTNKRNYKERLEPLRQQRMIFIFDECHRSQFGENHKAIKEFFPNAQLVRLHRHAHLRAERQLPSRSKASRPAAHHGGPLPEATPRLHHHPRHRRPQRPALPHRLLQARGQATRPNPARRSPRKPSSRPFSPSTTPPPPAASTPCWPPRPSTTPSNTTPCSRPCRPRNGAADPDFQPLNIACVFSPPAEGNKDVQQIQEDLPQERRTTKDPDKKKAALKAIIADYNTRYGTNHRHRRVRPLLPGRAKAHQGPAVAQSADLPHAQKIDITIVVDMLLTGFDSKYLNTLYVDKNLKHHGLIQAFSRTNRVLNDTKPYGNILDFRQQQDAVDTAIALFSGEKTGQQAREIWLVDKAPVVIEKLEDAVRKLDNFLKSQGLATAPEAVPNLKGDESRAAFIQHFKEVQRLKTQLDQYTDLTLENKTAIEHILPDETHRGFRGAYLETAQRLREQRQPGSAEHQPGTSSPADQLDFEFVLFASAVIDYDYIMGLIAKFSAKDPGKSKMTREQLIGLISSDAKFMNERDDIAEYIGTLKAGEGLAETVIREGYTRFKAEKAPPNLPPSPKSTASPPPPCKPSWTHPGPHDLRWRAARRPPGPARPRLESPHPGRTRPHGRPPPPPHQARRRPRHLGAQRV
jgi:type I restriction enzyme R subunit